jgi:DoxX-like family
VGSRVMTSNAGVFASVGGLRTRSRVRTIAYWVTAAIMAWEMFVGGSWDFLRIPYVYGLVVEHLGCPEYFLVIMGLGKWLAGLAMVLPRLPRLKEWAYAGAFLTYSGAVASHIALGDGPELWAGPAGFGLICLASWALRPASRRDVTPH